MQTKNTLNLLTAKLILYVGHFKPKVPCHISTSWFEAPNLHKCYYSHPVQICDFTQPFIKELWLLANVHAYRLKKNFTAKSEDRFLSPFMQTKGILQPSI